MFIYNLTVIITMGMYLGQDKVTEGVIFHYLAEDKRHVESVFYSTEELDKFANTPKVD